jgi:hypothetical protein
VIKSGQRIEAQGGWPPIGFPPQAAFGPAQCSVYPVSFPPEAAEAKPKQESPKNEHNEMWHDATPLTTNSTEAPRPEALRNQPSSSRARRLRWNRIALQRAMIFSGISIAP